MCTLIRADCTRAPVIAVHVRFRTGLACPSSLLEPSIPSVAHLRVYLIRRTATSISYVVWHTRRLNSRSYGVSDSRRTTKEAPSSHHKSVSSFLPCNIITDPTRLDIKLEPSTSNYDISLKILVDGQEAHRLPAIKRRASLSWDKALSWFDIRLLSI